MTEDDLVSRRSTALDRRSFERKKTQPAIFIGSRDPQTGLHKSIYSDGSGGRQLEKIFNRVSQNGEAVRTSNAIGSTIIQADESNTTTKNASPFTGGNCVGYFNGQIFDCDEGKAKKRLGQAFYWFSFVHTLRMPVEEYYRCNFSGADYPSYDLLNGGQFPRLSESQSKSGSYLTPFDNDDFRWITSVVTSRSSSTFKAELLAWRNATPISFSFTPDLQFEFYTRTLPNRGKLRVRILDFNTSGFEQGVDFGIGLDTRITPSQNYYEISLSEGIAIGDFWNHDSGPIIKPSTAGQFDSPTNFYIQATAQII